MIIALSANSAATASPYLRVGAGAARGTQQNSRAEAWSWSFSAEAGYALSFERHTLGVELYSTYSGFFWTYPHVFDSFSMAAFALGARYTLALGPISLWCSGHFGALRAWGRGNGAPVVEPKHNAATAHVAMGVDIPLSKHIAISVRAFDWLTNIGAAPRSMTSRVDFGGGLGFTF